MQWKIYRINREDGRNVLRFLAYMREQIPLILSGFIVMLAGVAASLVPPLINKKLFDEVLPNMDAQLLLRLGLLTVVFMIGSLLLDILTQVIFINSANRLFMRLRGELYDKLQGQSWDYLDRMPTGDMMARITNDVGNVRGLLAERLVRAASDIVQLLLVCVFMIRISPALTSVLVPVIPLFLIYSLWAGKPMKKLIEAEQNSWVDYSKFLEERLSGLRLIQAACSQTLETGLFRSVIAENQRIVYKKALLGTGIGGVGNIIAGLAPLLLLVFGMYQIIGGKLSLGSVIAFFHIFTIGFGCVHRLFLHFTLDVQAALVSVKRIFEILDLQPSVQLHGGIALRHRLRGLVEFKDVHFGYETDKPILNGIDLCVEAGAVVALVGPSGSGKSTLVKLIPRFYTAQHGGVYVDDTDVAGLDVIDYRKQIGYVPQDVFLFNRTVKDNLTYGLTPCPGFGTIERATTLARASEFICRLPNGYDTVIGKNGISLSGGERQRLAIAREILRDPAILILDEATSALDTGTEWLVREALTAVAKNRTTVIVAHRLSTVLEADSIAVLINGRIVERGTHAELVERGGEYFRLYERQFAQL